MVRIIASIYELDDIKKLYEAGANAIVVGTPFYSVRSASHLTYDELKQAKALCQAYHIELYVLVNRICMEEELSQVKQHLQQLKELDVDGIYFSDMGVFEVARQLAMTNKMIYNPDTILTNHFDIQAYLDLGMKMCTLSKEITLEDMVSIGKKTNGNLEAIVHGRLHMMHSKRNLLSNYMTFLKRDQNLKNNTHLYLMEETRDEHMPIIEDEHGTHVFTGFTLCTFEEVEDLLDANITNLRIESLFMDMEEICAVIRDYHKVIENPAKGREMYQTYQKMYPQENITKGFLYKKTGLLK